MNSYTCKQKSFILSKALAVLKHGDISILSPRQLDDLSASPTHRTYSHQTLLLLLYLKSIQEEYYFLPLVSPVTTALSYVPKDIPYLSQSWLPFVCRAFWEHFV